MDEFLIPSASGSGGLHFYDRVPFEPDRELTSYLVRLTDHNLSATLKVYSGYAFQHPAALFEAMAQQWQGWPNELRWESLEEDLVLRCTHDRKGHIAIRVRLRSGPMPEDWDVAATVMAEAGQLEGIALRARAFFGREGREA